jgi:hypothetical protein
LIESLVTGYEPKSHLIIPLVRRCIISERTQSVTRTNTINFYWFEFVIQYQ